MRMIITQWVILIKKKFDVDNYDCNAVTAYKMSETFIQIQTVLNWSQLCEWVPDCRRLIAMGLWKSKYPTLDSANKMTKTLNGNVINSKTKYRFVTKRDMEDIARDTNTNDQIRVIISPPFSDFTQVKPNLYMTSIGGMVRENINTNHIKVIISVTHEAPKYWVRGIHFVRIPVSRWPD